MFALQIDRFRCSVARSVVVTALPSLMAWMNKPLALQRKRSSPRRKIELAGRHLPVSICSLSTTIERTCHVTDSPLFFFSIFVFVFVAGGGTSVEGRAPRMGYAHDEHGAEHGPAGRA